MIKIAICDDEINMANEFERDIQQMPINNIKTEVFLSGSELLKNYSLNGGYNIVLLDIEMPFVNGIETARKLREIDSSIILIFVTAYKEYVYQIFETLPFRFLEKPISYEKIFEVIKDAIHYVEDMRSYFFFKKGTTDYQVPAKEILYFEAANRKIKIYTADSIESYYGKFKRLMEQLNHNYFLQIHTSFIVNMDYVASFNEKCVILSNNITLPISLKYRKDAQMEHLRFIERRCGKW